MITVLNLTLSSDSSFSFLSFPPLNLFMAATPDLASDNHVVIGALLVSALVFFVTSKIGEELCAWLNLPPVLGQLLGGIVVGVSALRLLVFPESEGVSISTPVAEFLKFITGANTETVTTAFYDQLAAVSVGIANLGVIALLFSIGLESNLKDLIRVGFQSATVAVAGVVLPFTLGSLGLIVLFDVPTVPAVFAGAALTATSIGITAKVLQDLGYLQSNEGQIILGAAVLDDILGIIILAVVVNLLETGTIVAKDVFYLAVGAAIFVIGAVCLSDFVGFIFVVLVGKLKTDSGLLISAVIFVLALACIANAIHLEAILGAFAAGLILGQTSKRHELEEQFRPIVSVVLPAFFVSIGAKTDLTVLNPANTENREGLIVAIFLIIVAILGKVVAGFLIFSKSPTNRLAIGAGMVPRGEVGLVFVGLGATTGILSESIEVAIVLMVIATTILAPILLRAVFTRSMAIATVESE